MTYLVIDNFLDQEDFKKIQDILIGSKFPWFFNKTKVFKNPEEENLNDFQFIHPFFVGSEKVSEYFYLVQPIFDKLPNTGYARTKANITGRTENIFQYNFHTDFKHTTSDMFTCVFYVNSNNGKTIFEDGTEIESIENRLLVFNADTPHAGTSCTDQKVRCVINLNYFGQLPSL